MTDREQLVREANEAIEWLDQASDLKYRRACQVVRRLLSLLPKEGEVVEKLELMKKTLRELALDMAADGDTEVGPELSNTITIPYHYFDDLCKLAGFYNSNSAYAELEKEAEAMIEARPK